MDIVVGGRRYTTLLCSDVDADGMYLELREITDEGQPAVADIFYSDQTHDMALSAYRENIPLELIEWLIQQARERLIPRATTND
ncbi:hypothetical protein [Microvirga terrestris]|uniref:Uncharacterized protein n=1 Tax=Microvirga terrestris TaxID=2791024 RepID=A0ABS0HPL7_9HYPH|nr:hypothetical protein [Microvirga terrestris]MBF9195420.1 hypothetical protein [Microvirga terrestris]